MAIERLEERKKWRFRRVPLGANTPCPSAGAVITSLDVTKQARVTGVNLEAPGFQQFDLVEIDGGAVTLLMPYRLESAGMIIDARTFDDPIAWVAAGTTAAVRTSTAASCAVSGMVRAGMDVWELVG